MYVYAGTPPLAIAVRFVQAPAQTPPAPDMETVKAVGEVMLVVAIAVDMSLLSVTVNV